MARVRAVLRRASQEEEERPPQVQVGSLLVDLLRHQVTVGERNVYLTPTEFKLLETLIQQPGRVFTRLELLERVFGVDYEGLERSVDEHVMNLRKKIEASPARPVYVQTVYGVGYKMNEAANE